jgi:hypothetical protein
MAQTPIRGYCSSFVQSEARVLLQTGDSLSWQCRNHAKLFIEEAAYRLESLLPPIRQETLSSTTPPPPNSYYRDNLQEYLFFCGKILRNRLF